MFVCLSDRYGSTTQDDCEAFTKYLSVHTLLAKVSVGELADAIYGVKSMNKQVSLTADFLSGLSLHVANWSLIKA
ncbi:DUF469 family protein [Alginatibacterium sediminis]|uniref:DUF469 family protein n=1 Tax=Alginatibacterium sediminis TaxID=2164068 RepID=A0A420EB96_9ALTE|nr:DUF469 family protein [Alginatibacterium sediminis]